MNIFFGEGNYNVAIVTRYKNSNQIIESKTVKATDIHDFSRACLNLGGGIGAGILIPLTDLLKVDISYSYNMITYNSGSLMRIQSLELGLNYNIK